MELPSAIATVWTIRPEASGPAFEQKNRSHWTSGYAWVANPPAMPRNPYWASGEKHYHKPTMFFTPSSRRHLYINSLINELHCFYHFTMSLK